MNHAAHEPPKGDGKDAPQTNSAQLKAAYDRGETGDKVAALDPGAAPLGTDAEAGGAPPSEAEIAASAALERRPEVAASREHDLVHNVDGRPGVRLGLLLGVLAAIVLGGGLYLLIA